MVKPQTIRVRLITKNDLKKAMRFRDWECFLLFFVSGCCDVIYIYNIMVLDKKSLLAEVDVQLSLLAHSV